MPEDEVGVEVEMLLQPYRQVGLERVEISAKWRCRSRSKRDPRDRRHREWPSSPAASSQVNNHDNIIKLPSRNTVRAIRRSTYGQSYCRREEAGKNLVEKLEVEAGG